MGFINERISEADKARINWSKFKAWPFSTPSQPSWWTIDREKDVFLVMLEGRGPDGERPETYALVWKGNVIRFEADVSGQGVGKFWETVFWKLRSVDIQAHLQQSKEEILDDLKAAIDAHGRFFDREHIKCVHIEMI